MSDRGKALKRKFFCRGDLIVLAVVLLTVIIGFASIAVEKASFDENDRRIAVISVGGSTVREIELDKVTEPYELEIKGDMSVVLEVSQEGVRFVSSECRDKLCVKSGLLTDHPDRAVCLPARVTVKIEHRAENSVIDAISG